MTEVVNDNDDLIMNNNNNSNQRRKVAIVIGAGIAGVSTAYYLARAGYDVRCYEKRRRVAREASFLNGGLVCPSLTLPWPCFGLVKTALVSLAKNDGNVRVKWSKVLFDPLFYQWVRRLAPSSFLDSSPLTHSLTHSSLKIHHHRA